MQGVPCKGSVQGVPYKGSWISGRSSGSVISDLTIKGVSDVRGISVPNFGVLHGDPRIWDSQRGHAFWGLQGGSRYWIH